MNRLVHKVISEKMQREKEEAKIAEEKKGQGWFGGWFGGGGAKKDASVDNKITQEDIDKINELIKSASNNEDVIETPDWYQFMNLNIQQRFADFKFVLKKNFDYGRVGGTQGTHDFQESEFEGLATPKGNGAYTPRSIFQENPNSTPFQEANQVNERIEFKITNVNIWVGVKTKGCMVKWAVEDLSVDYKENKYATPLNIFSPKRLSDVPTSPSPKKQSLVIEPPIIRVQSDPQTQFSKKRTSSIGEADSLGPILRKLPILGLQPDEKPNYIEFALETCPQDSPEIDCQIKIVIKTSKILYLKKMMKTVVEIFAIETENQNLQKFATSQTERALESSKGTMQDIIKNRQNLKINISAESPYIVIPFDQENIFHNECWIFSPGVFKMNCSGAGSENCDPNYDLFDIKMEKVFVEYMPTFLHFQKKYFRAEM